RAHHPGVRQTGAAVDSFKLVDHHLYAARARRSEPQASRHRTRALRIGLGAACVAARGPDQDRRLLPKGHRRVVGAVQFALTPLRLALWAVVIAALGLAIALPEPVVALVGAFGAAASIVALVRPLVVLPLLLVAVPFGGLARGSSGDSTSDLSFGAVEVL